MAKDLKVKAIESFELKEESTGEVEAVIATLGVVDRDGEVIAKGAIKNGSKVKMSSYGHDIIGGFMGSGALPVGKGAVFVEGDKVIFRGKVFLSTERGRETLAVLKELGSESEWSFGFRVLGTEVPDDAMRKLGADLILTKLDVFEVSPVVIGAGIGTQTVSAKEADEEAARVKAEQEAAEREAADLAAAEKVKADAEAADAAGAAEAAEAAEQEATKAAEAEAQKSRTAEAMEEFHRVQRTLKRLGVA